MQKEAPLIVLMLRALTKEREASVKSTARKQNVTWRKLREEGNQRSDVTSRQIDCVMLRPKATALQYIQTEGIVDIKVGDEWFKFKLLDADQTKYKEPSPLWKRVNKEGDSGASHQTQGTRGKSLAGLVNSLT